MQALESQDHRDGHGLADSITVYADDRDPDAGGASHTYTAEIITTRSPAGEGCLSIQFQHGGRALPDSTPGALDGVLITILLDRYRAFQAGPFASRENAIVVTKLKEALMWIHKRAHDRASRGVLGKNLK